MDDLPRRKLMELVGRFGHDVANDARRCEGLLRDFCPQHKREVFLLVSAAKESVPAELSGSSSGMPREVLLSRLTKRLHDNLGVAEDLARWSVESWALALGVISAKETTLVASAETVAGGTPPVKDEEDLFAEFPKVSGEEILRQTIRGVLAHGIVTDADRAEVQKLRKELGITSDVAARVLAEVKAETGIQQPGQIGRGKQPVGSDAAVPWGQKEISVELGNGVKLDLLLIPAGEFLMGSPDSDKDAQSHEKPQHRVRITKPFYLGKYLVTQEQWKAAMGNNPSHFKGPKDPVTKASWDDCQQFLEKLNERFAPGRGKFKLPTEAQWEYACRAGSTTKYYFGDDESKLGEYAWYTRSSDEKTHPVGEKKPNAWGLYDMHGNVWESCQDWYDDGYYEESPTDDPTGPATGSYRVGRGNGWFRPVCYCRSACRFRDEPGTRGNLMGLRVSLVPADK